MLSENWGALYLTTEEIKKFSNDCDSIFYKNNIVLEYGGGVIGTQCSRDFKRNTENDKTKN
jgi:hypothetical protein